MLNVEETIEFWAAKMGLSKKGKNQKKRIMLREAKKLERQSRYPKKGLGKKAVEIQRRKKKQMMRIQEGRD